MPISNNTTNNITGQESHSQTNPDSIRISIAEEEVTTPRPNLFFINEDDYVIQVEPPIRKRRISMKKSVSFSENLCEVRYFTTILPLVS